MKMKWKSGRRAPLASELAIGLGSVLLAWGYRRWRRKAKEGSPGGEGMGGTIGSRKGSAEGGAEAATREDAKSLSDRWKSLDEQATESHVPKELERMPKGTE